MAEFKIFKFTDKSENIIAAVANRNRVTDQRKADVTLPYSTHPSIIALMNGVDDKKEHTKTAQKIYNMRKTKAKVK